MSYTWKSAENRNSVFVVVFLVIKGYYKTSAPHKWLSKAKNAMKCTYFDKCDLGQFYCLVDASCKNKK